jgi:hypothetical protein
MAADDSDQHHDVAVPGQNLVGSEQLQRLGQCLGNQEPVEWVVVVRPKLRGASGMRRADRKLQEPAGSYSGRQFVRVRGNLPRRALMATSHIEAAET